MSALRAAPQAAGTQVLSTGQTLAHCGASAMPSHSLHLAASMAKTPSAVWEIASFGHSDSQALQLVHWSSTIMYAMVSASPVPVVYRPAAQFLPAMRPKTRALARADPA